MRSSRLLRPSSTMASSVKASHLGEPSPSRLDATWYRTSFGAEERLVGVSRSKGTRRPSALVTVKQKPSPSRVPLLIQSHRSSTIDLRADFIPIQEHGWNVKPRSKVDEVDSQQAEPIAVTYFDSQESLNGSKGRETTTLPLTPRPSRLPTPDLPDISSSCFCTCCTSLGTE